MRQGHLTDRQLLAVPHLMADQGVSRISFVGECHAPSAGWSFRDRAAQR